MIAPRKMEALSDWEHLCPLGETSVKSFPRKQSQPCVLVVYFTLQEVKKKPKGKTTDSILIFLGEEFEEGSSKVVLTTERGRP